MGAANEVPVSFEVAVAHTLVQAQQDSMNVDARRDDTAGAGRDSKAMQAGRL